MDRGGERGDDRSGVRVDPHVHPPEPAPGPGGMGSADSGETGSGIEPAGTRASAGNDREGREPSQVSRVVTQPYRSLPTSSIPSVSVPVSTKTSQPMQWLLTTHAFR